LSVHALTADGWKLVTATATGPGLAVTVAAGANADIDLTVAANPANIKAVLGFISLAGLPDGIDLVGVTYPNLATVRVRVRNNTTGPITIAAGSVSASILAKAA
jgi:hypothetical protein